MPYTLQDFKSGKTFYYIDPKGKVVELIIHSGISPKGALTLSKAFVLFDTWSEANDVLKELQNTFTFYGDK